MRKFLRSLKGLISYRRNDPWYQRIEEAYRTGRGKIRVRAVTDIETMPNGKSRIIVTELPYMVNKARLIEKIAEMVRDKKIDGITDLSDQSNREGMRVVIELRKDVNANVLLNQLYKHTQLQDTFGVDHACACELMSQE